MTQLHQCIASSASFAGSLLALLMLACSGTSNPAVSGSATGGATDVGGSTNTDVASSGGSSAIDGSSATGGIVGAGGTIATGGTTSDSNGPTFAQYNPPGDTYISVPRSANATAISTTYYYYIKNTGGSGVATVTVSYQGKVETKQFTVESGTQYVLASTFPFPSVGDTIMVDNCAQSVVLPGLTINNNYAITSVASSAYAKNLGKCSEIFGPSTSELIPLTSCALKGSCINSISATNCGYHLPC